MDGRSVTDKKATQVEILTLKRELVEMLNSNENANMALKRLKLEIKQATATGFVPKKKNVRIKASTNVTSIVTSV